jgi:hypothetical protein
MQFAVGTADPVIGQSFLLRQKIEYRWNFELNPKKQWWELKTPATIKLRSQSLGPLACFVIKTRLRSTPAREVSLRQNHVWLTPADAIRETTYWPIGSDMLRSRGLPPVVISR